MSAEMGHRPRASERPGTRSASASPDLQHTAELYWVSSDILDKLGLVNEYTL